MHLRGTNTVRRIVGKKKGFDLYWNLVRFSFLPFVSAMFLRGFLRGFLPGRLSDERNQYFSTNFREHFPNFWKKNSPSPRQPTWHSKLISFPLISLCKRGPMLRSPLKLWSSKSWQWLSHFSFSSFSSFLNKLPFHFIPFHFFSFPWSRYNKEEKILPKNLEA